MEQAEICEIEKIPSNPKFSFKEHVKRAVSVVLLILILGSFWKKENNAENLLSSKKIEKNSHKNWSQVTKKKKKLNK